jgi:YD repeat-containing protein
VSYTATPQRLASDVFDPSYSLIRRTLRWGAPVAAAITGPNGVTSSLVGDVVGGQVAVVSNSQPAGSGCAAASRTLEYNTDLTVARSSDFSGNFTCFGYGGPRQSETTRVEGLPSAAACASLLPPGVALPKGSRKTSTAWHPDWQLAVKVAEPGRITSFIYNGQPDPFNGNQVAACAPGTARLPDGKPLAVLCAQIEQASADDDGRQGLSAPLQPGVSARVRRWTYNQFGQMLTEQDPLGHVSTYTYHATTSLAGEGASAVGQVIGDLAAVSLPAAIGGAIKYTKYNKMGRPVETVDLNEVISIYTYDLRQRLTSVNVAGQLTRREYWPTGLLKKVIRPDGSFIAFQYDGAHRLRTVQDNAGNRVVYTLDNMGNRTAETFVDPSGVLRRSLSRSFDALGRVQQVTGRE